MFRFESLASEQFARAYNRPDRLHVCKPERVYLYHENVVVESTLLTVDGLIRSPILSPIRMVEQCSELLERTLQVLIHSSFIARTKFGS